MSQFRSVTRRQFLRRSGKAVLAAGAGLALPNIFLNQTKAASGQNPSDFIRIGFIGVGDQGRANLRALMKHAVAVCDVDANHLARARAAVEEANSRSCEAYRDYRKLLENKSIDAVVISTPDHWHTLPAIHACQAGKDVYCEKPLTLTIAEGQALVKVARRTNRVFQTGSQQRSEAKFRRACELVRSGYLGAVKEVRVGIAKVNWPGPPSAKLPAQPVPDGEPPPELDYDFWLGPAPMRPYNRLHVHYNFRFYWDYSGGQLTNWGTHHLDIAQWGLGMGASGPHTIEGRARYQPDGWYDVPEWCEVTYQYPGDVRVICGMDQRMGVEFVGDKGRIYVNRGNFETEPEELAELSPKSGDVQLPVSSNHYQDWLGCIKTRRQPIGDVETGHRSATVCHLGNIAIRTGRKITWDPVKERIIGDAKAAKLVSRPYRAPWQLPQS